MQKYGFFFVAICGFGLASASTERQTDLYNQLQSGPTLQLEYTPEQLANSVDAFMYFVPLNSLTGVRTEIDPNTNFSAGIINWQRKDTRKNTFTLTCDFEVSGTGIYKVIYEPGEMINFVGRKKLNEKKLTGLLDWIQFDGNCRGQVEASGVVKGKEAIIETISIRFNRNGQRSPVTIAIYDVPRVDNRYDYGNRQNKIGRAHV